MSEKFDLVLGPDWMALYKDGVLVAEGAQLAFTDILESLGMPVEIWEADIEWAEDRDGIGYPPTFNEVVLEVGYEEHLTGLNADTDVDDGKLPPPDSTAGGQIGTTS